MGTATNAFTVTIRARFECVLPAAAIDKTRTAGRIKRGRQGDVHDRGQATAQLAGRVEERDGDRPAAVAADRRSWVVITQPSTGTCVSRCRPATC